ncbi:MAG: hypothetical protein H6957_03450 [Chromatiaceae bacterium]|nr:hypothetical protein [Chromatiaceae bacterium]
MRCQTHPQRMHDIRPIRMKSPAVQDHRRAARRHCGAVRLKREKRLVCRCTQFDRFTVEQGVDDLLLQPLLAGPVRYGSRDIGVDHAVTASQGANQQDTGNDLVPTCSPHRQTLPEPAVFN